MKYNLRLSIPLYKILYSIAFMFLFALIRPTATISEILVVIEPNICFLAIVFISDIYYCEFRENRIDVFYLMPNKLKFKTVMQRFFIDIIYLMLLVIVFFWIYVIFQPGGYSFKGDIFLIYGYTILGCLMTILFFSALTCTLVNLLQNLWLGIAISASVWLAFSTTLKEYIPTCLNIFAYRIDPGLNARITPYFLSRGIYMFIGLGMLLLNCFIVILPPKRKVKKGKAYDRH